MPCIVRWPGQVPAGSTSGAVATAMDLLPTLAGWCDAELDPDRVIDGRDLAPVLTGATIDSPHEAFFYYQGPNLEAVRAGRWKLHVAKTSWHEEQRPEMAELYDLATDIGETRDVAADHPEIVSGLRVHLERARADLGDGLTGTVGSGCRPKGEVDEPVPLTRFDPDHPYFMAEYDLPDRG